MKTVVAELSAALGAGDRSWGNGNALWGGRWDARVAQLMALAPSGAGFDSGTRIETQGADSGVRIVFLTAFHHMGEHGMYTRWTEHKVIVTAAFNGINIRVTGRDHNGIKDYIGEAFAAWLTSEAPPVPW